MKFFISRTSNKVTRYKEQDGLKEEKKKFWEKFIALIIHAMYSEGIRCFISCERVYFWILEKYYISQLCTLRNENIETGSGKLWITKISKTRKSEFPCYFGSPRLSGGFNGTQSQCRPLNSVPHSRAPPRFSAVGNFRRESLNPKRFAASHFARRNQTARGCAFMTACARVPCVSFRTLAVVRSYRVRSL